ncbi:MAG TPA: hypothetical protein VNJ70_09925 [Thermoanaerobaculia bacterium]|nr:hypothetical protein [Thermoanaerobaculia bacterium]
MPTDVVQLFREASELSEEDRATLAGLLIESLESERDDGASRRVIAGNQVGRLNGLYAQLAPERSLSEELIRERRQQAQRERKR